MYIKCNTEAAIKLGRYFKLAWSITAVSRLINMYISIFLNKDTNQLHHPNKFFPWKSQVNISNARGCSNGGIIIDIVVGKIVCLGFGMLRRVEGIVNVVVI